MCGNIPFGEEAEDPYEIYQEIIRANLKFPQYLKDNNARLFITQLLNKIPETRLGGSYPSLKSHVWFSNFEWVGPRYYKYSQGQAYQKHAPATLEASGKRNPPTLSLLADGRERKVDTVVAGGGVWPRKEGWPLKS